MLRLFACIWIPNDLRDKIIKLQEEILKLPIKAKFVEPENLHLTVTFLGNIKENDVDFIIKNLDNATKEIKKFSITLAGLKVIPNESYVRVLGVNVTDGRNIVDLIKVIGEAIDGKYYETAKLTLCRVKNVRNKYAFREFIERNRNVKIGEFGVESVALVKSTLTRAGPAYETIHESMLQ